MYDRVLTKLCNLFGFAGLTYGQFTLASKDNDKLSFYD